MSDQSPRLGFLFLGQAEFPRQVEDVARPGVAVQFGGKREAHPATAPKVGNLLDRQRGTSSGMPMQQLASYTRHKDRMLERRAVQIVLEREKNPHIG